MEQPSKPCNRGDRHTACIARHALRKQDTSYSAAGTIDQVPLNFAKVTASHRYIHCIQANDHAQCQRP